MSTDNHPPDQPELAYEPPELERPASAIPTEAVLEQEAAPAPHDPYAALRLKEFRWYISGWILSIIGQQLQSVAIGWDIYQRTQKPLSLGWVGLIQAIPIMVLALPAGQLADWVDRKKIIVATQFLSAACSIALAILSWRHGSIGAIYLVLLAGGCASALSWPARSALLPQIVPTELFSNAVAWNSSFFQLAGVVGPAIGGLVIFSAVWPAYIIDAACATSFAIFAAMIPLYRPPTRRDPATLKSLVAGIGFVWNAKIILATMTLDLFAVLLGGAVALLPVFARDILHVGSFRFGCMRAAPAVGAVLMALIMAHRPPMKKAGQAMLWAVAGFGVATIVFGFSHNYWLSLAMLFLTGAFDNISVFVRHTLVQIFTPDAMRGRVSAVNNVFIGSSNELGAWESGATAQWWGTVASVVFGGIGTILVVIAVAMKWPQIRNLGSLQDAAVKEEDEPRGLEVKVAES